jgi:hypothetical protein
MMMGLSSPHVKVRIRERSNPLLLLLLPPASMFINATHMHRVRYIEAVFTPPLLLCVDCVPVCNLPSGASSHFLTVGKGVRLEEGGGGLEAVGKTRRATCLTQQDR